MRRPLIGRHIPCRCPAAAWLFFLRTYISRHSIIVQPLENRNPQSKHFRDWVDNSVNPRFVLWPHKYNRASTELCAASCNPGIHRLDISSIYSPLPYPDPNSSRHKPTIRYLIAYFTVFHVYLALMQSSCSHSRSALQLSPALRTSLRSSSTQPSHA